MENISKLTVLDEVLEHSALQEAQEKIMDGYDAANGTICPLCANTITVHAE